MHLTTKTRTAGIVCYFADAGKHTGETFCTIKHNGLGETSYWQILGCPMSNSGRVFHSLEAIEYYALAMAIEYLDTHNILD